MKRRVAGGPRGDPGESGRPGPWNRGGGRRVDTREAWLAEQGRHWGEQEARPAALGRWGGRSPGAGEGGGEPGRASLLGGGGEAEAGGPPASAAQTLEEAARRRAGRGGGGRAPRRRLGPEHNGRERLRGGQGGAGGGVHDWGVRGVGVELYGARARLRPPRGSVRV